MKIKIITILILSLAWSSCNNEGNQKLYQKINLTTITINNISEAKIMAYSDLFDSISLIKLETTKESLIGNIDKLISYNNFYFILDMAQSKAVFEFDNKGKFLRKIGQKGKGPGEYLEPHDIAVDQFSGRIIIYDGRKLLFYDFEGKFIEEIKLSFSFRSFSVLSKDVLAYYFDNSLKEKDLHKLKFNLLFVNKKGKILSQSFDVDENIYPTSGSRSFFLSIQSGIISFSKLLKYYLLC